MFYWFLFRHAKLIGSLLHSLTQAPSCPRIVPTFGTLWNERDFLVSPNPFYPIFGKQTQELSTFRNRVRIKAAPNETYNSWALVALDVNSTSWFCVESHTNCVMCLNLIGLWCLHLLVRFMRKWNDRLGETIRYKLMHCMSPPSV